MSGRNSGLATSEMGKIFGDPGTYPIFETNDDNAALHYLGSFPNNHPNNENRKTRDDHRVSKTIIDIQWTNSPYVDWRLCLYAELDGNNTYEGMPNGLTSSQAASYNENGIKNTSKLGNFFTAATNPGMLMSFAELKFILAEAAHKGFIPGGDTKAGEYYLEGIMTSYAQFGDDLVAAVDHNLGLPSPTWDTDSLALDFYANDVWGWDAGNAMELIGTQKWVAMFDQGLQSFIEWRRIGYPVLQPAVEKDPAVTYMPLRFPYPTDEAARNPSNLAEGISLLGGPDDLNTRVWWDMD